MLELLHGSNDEADGGGVAFSCWSTAEAAVALLCANLPLLRPLFLGAHRRLLRVWQRSDHSHRGPLDKSLPALPSNINPTSKQATATMRSTESQVWGLEEVRAEEEKAYA